LHRATEDDDIATRGLGNRDSGSRFIRATAIHQHAGQRQKPGGERYRSDLFHCSPHLCASF